MDLQNRALKGTSIESLVDSGKKALGADSQLVWAARKIQQDLTDLLSKGVHLNRDELTPQTQTSQIRDESRTCKKDQPKRVGTVLARAILAREVGPEA